VYSLIPEPNAETWLPVPAGRVGDIPGADLMRSNMLDRRRGVFRRYSFP
jgi:hypothetical protein